MEPRTHSRFFGCPDAAFLDLESTVQSQSKVSLDLTISFAEQTFELLVGSVSIALSVCHLVFELEGCHINYGDRKLTTELPLDISVTLARGTASLREQASDSSGTMDAKVADQSLSAALKVGAARKTSETRTTQDTLTTKLNLIGTSGTPTNPSWTFRSPTADRPLFGSLIKRPLADLTIDYPFASLTARLRVRPRDVVITYSDGLWPSNLSANKHAVIRLILLRSLRRRLYPNVAKIEVTYGQSP